MGTARGTTKAIGLLLLLGIWCATDVEASCGDYVMTRAEMEQHAKAGQFGLTKAERLSLVPDDLSNQKSCSGLSCRRSDPFPTPVPTIVTLELVPKSVVRSNEHELDLPQHTMLSVNEFIVLTQFSTEVWRPPETRRQR